MSRLMRGPDQPPCGPQSRLQRPNRAVAHSHPRSCHAGAKSVARVPATSRPARGEDYACFKVWIPASSNSLIYVLPPTGSGYSGVIPVMGRFWSAPRSSDTNWEAVTRDRGQ